MATEKQGRRPPRTRSDGRPRKPAHPSGPCIRADCDRPGGHGPKQALCERHAQSLVDAGAEIMRRTWPDQMHMHEGPPASLSCGHSAVAGRQVARFPGNVFVCDECALAQGFGR